VKESFRVQRVEKEVHALLSEYLTKNLRFSALTTVLRVQANKELSTAKVYMSVLGDDDQRAAVMDRLDQEVYQIQGFLNKQMRMKMVPRIRFYLDLGLDHMAHVQGVIANLKGQTE